MTRVNIGCGQSPTAGWRNLDNSLSIRLASIPLLPELLYQLKLLETRQYRFIQFARTHHIEYGAATKPLPFPSGSVDVLYSSHMFEHLDRADAELFLKEARRILRSGGIIRLAIPDLNKNVTQYIESGDADAFIAGTHLCAPRPKSLAQRLRLLLVGTRHHAWMYDGASLARLLQTSGFLEPAILSPGETMIENPGSLNLAEQLSASVYVEARNP